MFTASLKIGKAAFEIIQAREEMKACARIMWRRVLSQRERLWESLLTTAGSAWKAQRDGKRESQQSYHEARDL